MIDTISNLISDYILLFIFVLIYFIVALRYLPVLRRVALFHRLIPQVVVDSRRLPHKLLMWIITMIDGYIMLFFLLTIFTFIASSIFVFMIGTGYGIGVYDESILSDFPLPIVTILLYISGLSLLGKLGYDVVMYVDKYLATELDKYDLYEKIFTSKLDEEE